MRVKNVAGIVACSILILGLASYISPLTIPSVHLVKASSRTISLVGYYPSWNNSNPTITVTKGDIITINLSSGDGATHRLLIDLDQDGEADMSDCGSNDICSSAFPPSTSIPPFTVTNAGSYHYYCTYHYPYMVGSFDVQNPPDFGISASPPSPTILQGSNANSTITVSSMNNFAGTITLSASASPSGPITSFNTNPVVVSAGSTASSKLTISIPPSTPTGSYSVTVTGTNGSSSGTHSTIISVSVASPNFSISPSPSSLTVGQGSSGTVSITITSINSFSGTVNLTATVSPSGPQLSLNPTSLALTSGGSATSTLTISTAASGYSSPVAQGNYALNMTASSGTIIHSTPVSLKVSSTSPPPVSSPVLPLPLIAGGLIGAIIVVTAVALFLRRRRH